MRILHWWFGQADRGRKVRITLVGDSQLAKPKGQAVDVVSSTLESLGHEVENLSISGQAMVSAIVRPPQINDTHPDAVVLWLGVNDWLWYGADPWTWAVVYGEYVRRIKSAVYCVSPILNKVGPKEIDARKLKSLDAYRWWAKAVADNQPNAHYIHGPDIDVRTDMYDKLHPDDVGSTKIAKYLSLRISSKVF